MGKLFKIHNQGLLDINELRLMGCSSKDGISTIGKFGTGLKYAIAVLIRENIDFTIYIGNNKVKFQTEDIDIRGTTFQKIIIDYENTSITTNLGVEWNTGQALREFIANAKDLGGGFEIVEDILPQEGTTTVVFHLEDIEKYLSDFVFEDWTEVDDGYYFKKLDSKRRAKVFKEGFLVYEAEDNSSYDYRIDNLKINESRVAEDRWEVKRGIAHIQSLMDKEDVKTIVENKETDLGIFYSHDSLGSGWVEIEKQDIGRNSGYELQKAVYKNIKQDSDDEQIKLFYNDRTYINHDKELEDGVYFIDEEGEVSDWDIDLKTFNIYIFKQHSESYYIDSHNNKVNYKEVINEAKEYKKAAIYNKENNLTTAIEATLHFLNKKDKVNKKYF